MLPKRYSARFLALLILLLTVSCSLLDNSQEARNRATLSLPTVTFQALRVVTPFEPTGTLAPAIAAVDLVASPTVPAADLVMSLAVPVAVTPTIPTPENPGAGAESDVPHSTGENTPGAVMTHITPAVATVAPSETVVATHASREINLPSQTQVPEEMASQAGASQPDLDPSPDASHPANLIQTATVIARSSPMYFADCATGMDNNATIEIPADMNFSGPMTLAAGDEIAVFSPDSTVCAGGGVWTGQNLIISAWSDDGQSEVVDGLRSGQVMQFRLWDLSSGIEYAHVVVTFAQGSGAYQVDGIYRVAGMTLLD